MNEQLKDFLKKASEDESIKDELKALEGLSAEENGSRAESWCRGRFLIRKMKKRSSPRI